MVAVTIHHFELCLTDAEYQRYWSILADDERERAMRFVQDIHRYRFVAARGHLRLLIADYLACQPQSIKFKYNQYGKPSIINVNFHFNMAHAKDQCLIAVNREKSLGVDIEYLDQSIEMQMLADRFFTDNESRELKALPQNQICQGFFNLWTRKEALLKALGQGLSFPLKNCELNCTPDKPAKIYSINGDSEEAAMWSLQALPENMLPQGFAAALAIRDSDLTISVQHQ